MKKSNGLYDLGMGFVALLMISGGGAFAQKVITPTGKNSAPRTTNHPVVIVDPQNPATGVPGTSGVPNAPGATGVPTTGVPGTTDTPGTGGAPATNGVSGPAATPTPVGVNGTTDVPTNTDQNGPLGGKTQVGGVADQKKEGKGGKRVGNTSKAVPAIRTVPETASGTQASQNDVVQKKEPKTEPKSDLKVASTPCEDEAIQKINAILMQDSSGVLSNLYELTSRRLALRALAQGSDSLEALVRKDIKNYEGRIAEMKDSEAIQAQVKAVYETYGKGRDLEKINDDFDRSFGKAKIACYWTNYRNNQRIWNEEASSYVLSLAIGEKDSGLSDLDAATIWTMEKVRSTAALTDPSYEYGQANGNLLNISTRVARYLGKIGGARHASGEEINEELESIQQAVDQSIEKAYAQVKTSLSACIEQRNKDCPDCVAKAKSEFENKRLSFDKIQRGLLQAVSKSENMKMEKALKAKMGDVNFDLSDFAIGTVPEDHRKTISKIDACGNPIKTKKVVRVPARTAKPAAKPRTESFQRPANPSMVQPSLIDTIDDGLPVPVKYTEPKVVPPELEEKLKAWETAHPGETFPVMDPKKTYIDDVE